MNRLSVHHLGFTPYREGLAIQQALIEARAAATTTESGGESNGL